MILPVMAATLGLALLVLSVSAADTEPEAIASSEVVDGVSCLIL